MDSDSSGGRIWSSYFRREAEGKHPGTGSLPNGKPACASYEVVQDLKTERKSPAPFQITHDSGLLLTEPLPEVRPWIKTPVAESESAQWKNEGHHEYQRGGRGSGPEILLKRFIVSGSLGIPFMAFACSSGSSGDGSAPVVFVKVGTNAGSLNVLRIASDSIWTCSFGVSGGKMKGEPMSVKLRCISVTFLTLSFFTNLSNVGKLSKAG